MISLGYIDPPIKTRNKLRQNFIGFTVWRSQFENNIIKLHILPAYTCITKFIIGYSYIYTSVNICYSEWAMLIGFFSISAMKIRKKS